MYSFNPSLFSVDETHVSRGSWMEPDTSPGPLSPELLSRLHRYWNAANYLCVGQIYLKANPLLPEPLLAEHIKPRLLGHWGTSVGQNFIYVHLNRLISERRTETLFISGPGHGGPTMNACAWLEGTYSEVHPDITAGEAGMLRFFRSFSTPAGFPATAGRIRPTRFTKAASWAIR
jgi:xylulose-5-phosphate/fructose-6-phosphate phosphoketolase